MPSFDFSVKNTINLNKIRSLAKECKTRVLVGWKSGEVHGNKKGKGISQETWKLAADLYYGTAKIPARPFFSDAVEENKTEIADVMGAQVKNLMNGKPADWKKVGSLAVGKVVELVRSDYYKTSIPNSPKTIELKSKKGKVSDTPLIDTADMIQKLTFLVEKGK